MDYNARKGIVQRVDRANGYVDAILLDGQQVTAKYSGLTPFVGSAATFQEMAGGSWICLGIQGEMFGYGPNLCLNADFVQDTSLWDTTVGATAWNFDGSTNSWAGTSCTLSNNTTYVYNGTSSLRVLATATTSITLRSPTGVSGVAVSAGQLYNATVWVLNDPSKTARAASVRIKWYTGAGAFISDSSYGTAVTTESATWRNITVSAIAPATAAFAAVEVQFASVTNGDIFFCDAAVLTGGSNTTLSRDTTNTYTDPDDGVTYNSLRIRSTAAGIIYANYPAPATDTMAGIPVQENQAYQVEMRFRQSNNKKMIVLAIWADANGTVFKTEFDQDSTSPEGTSSFQLFSNVFRVPKGAVTLHVAVACIVSAGTQDLNITRVNIRQVYVWEGSVWSSKNTVSTASEGVGPLFAKVIPSESGYPKIVFNGTVHSRAIHTRLSKVTGTQSIANNTWTTVSLDTVNETSPAWAVYTVYPGTPFSIRIARSGYYEVSGQINWATMFFGNTWNSAVAIERYDVAGTFLERPCASSLYFSAGSTLICQSASMTIKCNVDDIILLRAYQTNSGGGALNLDAGAGAVGGSHMLSATYVGDAA